MRVTIEDRGTTLRGTAARATRARFALRCAEHGKSITAVTIHGFDNGWFDAMWSTCCEGLRQQAVAIVKARC